MASPTAAPLAKPRVTPLCDMNPAPPPVNARTPRKTRNANPAQRSTANASGAAAAPMAAFGAACKERGLWPFIHFNRTHVVPPCTITDEDARTGLAILDDVLAEVDGFYEG